jgi:hypothetical protein
MGWDRALDGDALGKVVLIPVLTMYCIECLLGNYLTRHYQAARTISKLSKHEVVLTVDSSLGGPCQSDQM